MEVTREQYSNWLDNEVTKQFFKVVQEMLDEKVEYLSDGGTLGAMAAERTSNVVGYIAALNQVTDMDAVDFVEGDYEH